MKRKYRIKTTIMKSGREIYRSQVKSKYFWWWLDIAYDGEATELFKWETSYHPDAEDRIKLHKKGNYIVKGTTETYYS